MFGSQKARTADLKNIRPGESDFYEPPNGHGKEYLEEWCKGFDAGWKQGMMRRGVQFWAGGKVFVPDR